MILSIPTTLDTLQQSAGNIIAACEITESSPSSMVLIPFSVGDLGLGESGLSAMSL